MRNLKKLGPIGEKNEIVRALVKKKARATSQERKARSRVLKKRANGQG